MNSELPLREFDQSENGLAPSEQISLYTALIKVIDEDLREIKGRSSREGWTVTGIITSIIAAGAALFSRLRMVEEIPDQTIEYGITSLITLYLLWAIHNALSDGEPRYPKSGRLVSSSKFASGKLFFIALRLVILGALFVLLSQSDFASGSISLTAIFTVFPIIYGLLSFWFIKKTGRHIGNNPIFAKTWRMAGPVAAAGYLTIAITLMAQLPLPLGPGLVSAFEIGLLGAAIVFLLESLFGLARPATSVAELEELRDDIVMRDISLNDATARYRIIREGKSSWDELRSEYDKLLRGLSHQGRILDEQMVLVRKQLDIVSQRLLPDAEEHVLQDLADEISQLAESYSVHSQELDAASARSNSELDAFWTRLTRVTEATGDTATDQTIRTNVVTVLQDLKQRGQQVFDTYLRVQEVINERHRQHMQLQQSEAPPKDGEL
jgi:hypothetical protein